MTTSLSDELVQIDEKSIEEQTRTFTSLLDDIDKLDDRKKVLWRSIYNNALSDRHNAFLMFKGLTAIVFDNATGQMKSTEMAVHGKTLTSYLERMSKCVDQMLKLADLVAAAQPKQNNDNILDATSIYDRLQSEKTLPK